MLKKYLTILPTLTMVAAMAGGATIPTDRAARHTVPVKSGNPPAATAATPGMQQDTRPN